jgi:putative endonuclease
LALDAGCSAKDDSRRVELVRVKGNAPVRRDPRQSLGNAGEAAAERWLCGAGFEIVARGFRARCGEIDLIARAGAVVVFIEVKTRTSEAFGRPCEAVTAQKRGRIARVASAFLARSGWTERTCRFDVVEVLPVGAGWKVTHIPDAFRLGD